MDELLATFVSRLPAGLPDAARDVERDLTDLVRRARAEAPGVELDAHEFVVHVADRTTYDAHGRPVLHTLHAGDLWIAFGCVAQHPQALAAFEARFAPEITNALARSFERALAEDAELKLRDRLFLVGEDEHPRLASYAGRGALAPWLRAAAARTAIDLMRTRRELPVDPGTLGDVVAIDPLLAQLKDRYRDEFRIAFAQAAAQLTDRDRTLLRYRFFDDLSIDEIGVLYRVHRATVARWIAAIRETLFESTRTALTERLSLTESEVDSVLRLIDSRLEISIEAMLR